MADVKTTEREFAIRLIGWLNEFISQGNYPFEVASGEASLKTSAKKTKFPDVQIWLNRQAGLGFCGWELKTPTTLSDDQTLLKDAQEKALAMNASYFVTWNMQKAIIWRMPLAGLPITSECRLKTYPVISQITIPDDLWVKSKEILLKDLARNILDDLAKLHQEGHLYEKDTDTTFFIKLLSDAVKQLAPLLKVALIEKSSERSFQDGLEEWAIKQGITNYGTEEFYDVISRQLIYRTLGKIILYQALRRFKKDLIKIDLNFIPPKKVTEKLNEYFDLARQIDYQAVFEKGYSDEVGIPAKAAPILIDLTNKLNQYNFSRMPVDVIGQVFEELIPPVERHNLGQYFTREDLVDLINAFCIREAKDKILDPTCGSGTFLTRAYNRLQSLGEHDHKKLLTQLWGVDIAHFPSELATINLYRQNLNDYANFPRIVRQDFFEVKPGQTFKFPPPKAGPEIKHIEEAIPQFDGIIGNFPYIRQELIEKADPTYKSKLIKVHQNDWIKDYPDFFDKNHSPKLSGQADIYASLFFHTAKFLNEQGRMGIVTSNSWLDVEYGYELQKFFLRHFKIIAIIESRCEPWFEDAAINTIVTVLERCDKKEERNRHIVKFVKLKKSLKELIPWDIKDPANRWSGLQRLVGRVEHSGKEYYKQEGNKIVNTLKGLKTVEDENLRTRIIKQDELLDEVEKSGKTVKWGKYLRAPEIYFEILDKCKDKLVPLNQVADIRRGYTTGINEFFYLTEEQIKHWGIEREFIKQIFKSPREAITLLIDKKPLKNYALICSADKKDLRKHNKTNVLRYIEWGETQKTEDGKYYSDVLSVRSRKNWYSIGIVDDYLVWPSTQRERLMTLINKDKLIIDKVMYGIQPDNKNKELTAALLNSCVTFLFTEVNPSLLLAPGGIFTTVEDVQNTLIPNPDAINKKVSDKIIDVFSSVSSRLVKSVFDEVKLKDRQKLNSLVLEALGLDPKKYLQPLYDGLCELVKERLDLAKMRKSVKKSRTERDTTKVKQDVIEEVLPDGPKKFPGDFMTISSKAKYKEIPVPKEPLKIGHHLPIYRVYEVITDEGFCHKAKTSEEAKFIVYSQRPNEYIVRMPEDKIAIEKAILDYERYLKGLKNKLYGVFAGRVLDPKLADNLTRTVFSDFNLPVM